jgi:hypothetical protein
MACEVNSLALAALGIKAAQDVTIAVPGGRSPMPLLAAVHGAALQLPGYPSPFSPRLLGPVVFATRQSVRREELRALDAAGVPVSPALHPVRLRPDGLCVPLTGGRPREVGPTNRLVLTRHFAPSTQLRPAAVIVDAVTEDDAFLGAAANWAHDMGATVVFFEDAARRRWPEQAIKYSCGWAARHTEPTLGSAMMVSAADRGHAAVIHAGPQHHLAKAAALLSDARKTGRPLPPVLVSAAVLWRRLDELSVPLSHYDAACPRWRTPTLSERLDDLAVIRSADFPDGWRTWAEMCWAGVKDGITGARDELSALSAKAAIIAEVVEAEHAMDFVLPSRIMRDAMVQYLAAAGIVCRFDDDHFQVRSLGDPDRWGQPRPTLLVSPPVSALRHRLTAGDIGLLNVLSYTHEINALRAALRQNLDELTTPSGQIDRLVPPGLVLEIDAVAEVPEVVLTSVVAPTGENQRRVPSLVTHQNKADSAILAALTADSGPSEIPDEALEDLDIGPTGADAVASAVVPLSVISLIDDHHYNIDVPVHRHVLRIVGQKATYVPILNVVPTMLIADLAGPTAFERLRSLLLETRSAITRMLLAEWDQALDTAVRCCGSVAALAQRLAEHGSTISASAVASWFGADRIGPRDPRHVAHVGNLAGHPVVEHNAAAIAEAMRQLRIRHQYIGKAIVGVIAGDDETTDELETLLGPDAVSVVQETAVYRVTAVGPITESPMAKTSVGTG